MIYTYNPIDKEKLKSYHSKLLKSCTLHINKISLAKLTWSLKILFYFSVKCISILNNNKNNNNNTNWKNNIMFYDLSIHEAYYLSYSANIKYKI